MQRGSDTFLEASPPWPALRPEPAGPPTILAPQGPPQQPVEPPGPATGAVAQAQQAQAASTAAKGSLRRTLCRNIAVAAGASPGAQQARLGQELAASPRTEQERLWQARLQGLSMALTSKGRRDATVEAQEQAEVQAEEQVQERHRLAAFFCAELADVCADKLALGQETAEASEQAQRPAQAQLQRTRTVMIQELARCALWRGSEELGGGLSGCHDHKTRGIMIAWLAGPGPGGDATLRGSAEML